MPRVTIACGLAASVLAGTLLITLFAGFFAPYDPGEQNRLLPDVPPMRIHVIDPQGKLRLPFVYAPKALSGGGYSEDIEAVSPLRILPSRAGRLFGVEAPGRIFLLGTDDYGRDEFSRLIYGGRISLLAGVLATLVSLGCGLCAGVLAGFYGGWADAILMRLADLFLALPWVYLLLAVRATLPLSLDPARTFLSISILIGFAGWAKLARLVRGIVLGAKERDYVEAARGFGATNRYLIFRHILPEVWPIVQIQTSLLVPQYILAEVTLSFLGLGVSEPAASWGSMLAPVRQLHVLASNWWLASPALILFPLFLSFYTVAKAMEAKGGWPNGRG